MRLRSRDETSVELWPVDYQFTAVAERGVEDWDANWLIIGGRVCLSDGRDWSFQDPCMTSWEAARLGDWLTAVAAGEVGAVPFDGGTEEDEERLLAFTEPNLAFSVAARRHGEVDLRVHLSLECLPPWLNDGGRTELFSFFVQVSCSLAAIESAREEWRGQLAPFPVR